MSPSLGSSAISGSGWVDALSSGTVSASLTGVTSPAKQALFAGSQIADGVRRSSVSGSTGDQPLSDRIMQRQIALSP
ncbi:hypothetical protein ABHD20_13530 [Enterobacter cloacae]|uniref:hypothetical protein n=1 Tax=Enterobacter cloacae TaxID=550 RepID=UPI00325BAEC2